MKLPVSASRVANATACTRMSNPSQRDFRCANPFEISSSEPTSMTKVISEPNCLASGTTRSVIRSICANASSAPWACMACAMPQAMERSVARPTISARLPLKKPIYILQALRAELTGSMRPRPIGCLALLAVRVDGHYQALSGSDFMMPVQAVPALELRDRDLELPRNAVGPVAGGYGGGHAGGGPHSLIAITP